jgi:hypothetical protein
MKLLCVINTLRYNNIFKNNKIVYIIYHMDYDF